MFGKLPPGHCLLTIERITANGATVVGFKAKGPIPAVAEAFREVLRQIASDDATSAIEDG